MKRLEYGQPMTGSAHRLFPKNWLNPKLMREKYGDILDLTIDCVTPEQTFLKRKNSHTDVFVLWTRELVEGLILNATNNDTVITLHGAEMRDWTDKPICLYIDPSVWNPNEGKKTDAIRVRQSTGPTTATTNADAITEDQITEICERGSIVYNGDWGKRFPQAWINHFTDSDPNATLRSLSSAQAERVLEKLRSHDADEAADSRLPEQGGQEPPPEAQPDEYYPSKASPEPTETQSGKD